MFDVVGKGTVDHIRRCGFPVPMSVCLKENIILTGIQNIGGISENCHGPPPVLAKKQFAANMPTGLFIRINGLANVATAYGQAWRMTNEECTILEQALGVEV